MLLIHLPNLLVPLPCRTSRCSTGGGACRPRGINRRGDDLLLGLFLAVRLTSLSKFIDSLGVDAVNPALVKPDKENDVIAQRRQTMQPGHLDGESEQVVDESVQELVHQRPAGHMSDGLQVMSAFHRTSSKEMTAPSNDS